MSKRAPRLLRWYGLGLAAVTVLLGPVRPAPARSKPPRQASAKASEELASRKQREGEAALQAGDAAAAERALSEAYRLHGTSALLFLMGKVASAQGRTVAMQDFWRRFVATEDSNLQPEQRAEAERALATAPPSGEVAVLGEPGGLVLLDGRVVALLPLPLPLLVEEGAHQVRLEYPRARAAPLLTTVNAKNARQVEVRFEPATGAVMVSERKAVLLFVHAAAGPGDPTARLQRAASEGLRNERLTAVLAKEPPDCANPERCQLAMLTSRSLPQAVVIDVAADAKPAPSAGPSYHATVSVLDAQVGELAARQEKRCDGCTADALATLIATACAEVVAQGLGRQRGELEVQSEPAGALLELSGRIVGPTPYRGVRFVGSYAAVLRHPGYREYTQAVDIVEGQPAQLRVALERNPVAAPALVLPRPQRIRLRELLPRPRWRLLLGAGLIAGGGLTAGMGAGALSVDGQCLDTPIPPAQQCEQRFMTLPLGASLVGVGAALTLLGVGLVAAPGPRYDYDATLRWRACPPPPPTKGKGQEAGTAAPRLCVTISEGER